MKFGVNKKILLYTAGCVWIFAGINILRIGIVTWLNDTHYWLFKIGEATIVFLLFFNLVFKRLFYKHSERISRKTGNIAVLFLRRERLDYHDLHDRFRDHDPCAPFTAEFFHFCILYGIIHGVDHNGILILETRKNRWELRIEN